MELVAHVGLLASQVLGSVRVELQGHGVGADPGLQLSGASIDDDATGGERVEGRSLHRQAQPSPDVGWMRPDIESRDAGDAARRPQQRGQDTDRRGLARTVGAEKAEELPRLNAEGNAVDGARAAGVHLGQVLDFDYWAGHRERSVST